METGHEGLTQVDEELRDRIRRTGETGLTGELPHGPLR